MLILSRKPGETIVIGDGPDAITVRVVRLEYGNRVQLAIEAPADKKILRGELEPLASESVDGGPQVGLN